MLQIMTEEDAGYEAVQTDDGIVILMSYFGSFEDFENLDQPQAYLVGQSAGSVLPPHFHEVDQFQVVAGGSGTLGRHAVVLGSVHYADRYTPYGPLAAHADDGLWYFTLRMAPGRAGLYPMPELKDRKVVRSGLQFTSDMALDDRPTTTQTRLLGETPDGAQAYSVHVEPGANLPSQGLGTMRNRGYVVVMAGAIRDDSREYPAKSVAVFDQFEELSSLVSGQDGAVLCYLKYRKALPYVRVPAEPVK